MNEQKFQIQVTETTTGYLLHLISGTGRVILSREYHARIEAEDERDFIAAAWGQVPLEALPTLVRKTVLKEDGQPEQK